LLAAILESAAQAILSVDRAGRIVLANRKCEEMFGYERAELLRMTVDDLLPESRREAHARERARYNARPKVRPMGVGMELAARRKNGTEFPVEVSLSYVQTPDGTYAIAFVSDISARKQLEEQFLQAQKMEAVGRLAGGMAHDFNNMLTVIAGYNHMLREELPPDSPLLEYIEEMRRAADRAAGLTNHLLTFSRRRAVRLCPLEVNEALRQTEKMLDRLIGEDIRLELHLDPDAGVIVADRGQLDQAIVNLAVNARDAMPEGGCLSIETANVWLDEEYAQSHLGVKSGEYVMIAVSDTGHGMDAETRRRIFEPFFTTKPKGKGTGLGLATVYGIVKQAGGDIWVYSEPGQGTTFKLYFPRVARTAGAPAPRRSGRTRAGQGETILVVEDEPAVRKLTVKLLERLGYNVLKAAGGEEALNASRDGKAIDLLVTDMVMPHMSGRQLAEKLAATRPGMKVLYLSGYTEKAALNHGVLEPGRAFLAKPFSRETLAAKIRELLGK
jgi:PAS domain S-box-containing protein